MDLTRLGVLPHGRQLETAFLDDLCKICGALVDAGSASDKPGMMAVGLPARGNADSVAVGDTRMKAAPAQALLQYLWRCDNHGGLRMSATAVLLPALPAMAATPAAAGGATSSPPSAATSAAAAAAAPPSSPTATTSKRLLSEISGAAADLDEESVAGDREPREKKRSLIYTSSSSKVKGMEIEVRSMKGNERRQCQSRANQCRADLKALRRSIDQQAGQRAQAEELMRRSGGGAIGGGPRNFSEGGGDLGGLGPDLAQQSLARRVFVVRLSLQDSRRVLEETEGIGRGVMGDLESQRESLLRSRASVRDTGAAAGQARRLLGSISRRELRHRLCLYAVIALLSAAIVFVLYLKIRRRSLL
ncbi:unnamed protein product [Ectocarpus sp. 12 AP-2014]